MVVGKKSLLAGIALLSLLPGCGGRKKDKTMDENKKVAQRMVNIPLAENEIMAESDIALEEETLRSFFEDDLQEFVAAIDDKDGGKQAARSNADRLTTDADNSEFAWVQGDDQAAGAFKTVFFDFDRSTVRPDQKNIVESDIQAARKVLAEARKNGAEPTIVIEGHSCHSAGSSAYNVALSERRAKAISDWFVTEGVARENIKIVGRGKEVPAVVDGKVVTGGREEQWPNRRVEVHVINS